MSSHFSRNRDSTGKSSLRAHDVSRDKRRRYRSVLRNVVRQEKAMIVRLVPRKVFQKVLLADDVADLLSKCTRETVDRSSASCDSNTYSTPPAYVGPPTSEVGLRERCSHRANSREHPKADDNRRDGCQLLSGRCRDSFGQFRETPKPRWTAQNRPLIDTSKPATTGVAAETNGVLLRSLLGAQVGLDLGAPAPRSAFEDVRVMEQPIEERGDGGGVAEQLAPVIHRSV
jgi:hypothetical protein